MNNSQTEGAITEQKCFLKCLEMGYQVSKPLFDNARYDFILDVNDKLLKIQIKTSRWKDDKKEAFIFNCYSQHSTGNGNKRLKYTKKEIDYFMTEKDGLFYLIPAPEKGVSMKTLRIVEPKTGYNKNNTSFAKDFLFEDIISNI